MGSLRSKFWYVIGLPRKRWAAPWRRFIYRHNGHRWHWGIIRFWLEWR